MATRLHHSIVEVIALANFMADALQVERLAGAVVEGQQADSTYLRVALAHMQARLGKPARRARRAGTDVETQETVLDAIHNELYPHVLKGVGPEDLPTEERNRRATFARSAASTVRFFIRGGGDVRQVDIATATKGGLRKAVQPAAPEAPANETRAEKSFRLAQEAVVKAAQRLLARGDPEAARQRIEGAMDALENLLLEMEEEQPAQAQQQDFGGTTTTIVGRQPVGRGGGAPAGAMLHRPAA